MNQVGPLLELVLWAQARRPAIYYFDQLSRAKVLLGIGAILILGVLMVYVAIVTSRLTKRYASRAEPHRESLRNSSVPPRDDWAEKEIVEHPGSDEPPTRGSDDEPPNHPQPSS